MGFQTCDIHQISLTDADRRNNEAISATTQRNNYQRGPPQAASQSICVCVWPWVCVCVSDFRVCRIEKCLTKQTLNYQRRESFGLRACVTHG